MNNKIIKENKGLVISIAKRYQHRGLDMDDLIQEGYIGLLLANARFKENMGTKFSTYASYWVRQTIVRAIENTGSLIRVPSNCNTTVPNTLVYDNHDTYDITSELEGNELISKIRDIIGDTKDFRIYLDYYMNDLSFREVGKKHKLSHETVRNKVKLLHSIIKDKLTK